MAERSADERINLWYQQYHHILTQARNEFYGLSQFRQDPDTYMLGWQQAMENVGHRIDYMQQNTAEQVQDRLDASAERAREALQQAPRYGLVIDTRHEPSELRVYDPDDVIEPEDLAAHFNHESGAFEGPEWDEQLTIPEQVEALRERLATHQTQAQQQNHSQGMEW